MTAATPYWIALLVGAAANAAGIVECVRARSYRRIYAGLVVGVAGLALAVWAAVAGDLP